MASSRCVLAGDVGGTKTLLALYRHEGEQLALVREGRYGSNEFTGLASIVTDFLKGDQPLAAAFGVAGPVIGGLCQVTNLPWLLDETTLSEELGGIPAKLLNDLEAAALGLLQLPEHESYTLNAGRAGQGNLAVVAAGTGLGESILYWDGAGYRSIAGEGGHCDFAPLDTVQEGLLAFLRERFMGHVSYERILSGDGLCAVYDYLWSLESLRPAPELAEALHGAEAAATIAHFGLERGEPVCRRALALFARIYGQESANLALKCMARGGVWLAGGIAPKILPVLADGSFMEGFCDKGRFSGLLREMPVRVCLNDQAPLLGAATVAASLPA